MCCLRRLVVCGMLLVALTAYAAPLRVIPPQARSASMSAPYSDRLALNGKPYRLAAGAQIRDARNFIVQPMHLQNLPEALNVRYLLDATGDVYRIWILTSEENGQAVNPAE